MRDAGIGRLLVAALHQGIADVLPMRLEFYEHWLSGEGLRHGTIGLAPLGAVLSFLRTEDRAAYDEVTRRAGTYAADWTVDAIGPLRRRAVGALPPAWRTRAALGIVRSIVRESYGGSTVRTRWRRGAGAVEVGASIFCGVRERWDTPLCAYYAAAAARVLARLHLPMTTDIVSCLAVGESACHIRVQAATGGEGAA